MNVERLAAADFRPHPVTIRVGNPIVAAVAGLIFGFALSARLADAQAPSRPEKRQPFRENVAFPLDGNLPKRLITVEEQIADKRWEEAISQIQEMLQTENKTLVPLQVGKPRKQGEYATYLNVATRCNLLLARLPPEGRAAYRQKVDPQAKRWYENWMRTRDEAELLRIVRQAFMSQYGDDAIWALGEAAWDRGEFSTASLWWEQLVPLPDQVDGDDAAVVLRYPDSNFEQPAILARIVLCSIMDGAQSRAAQQLKQLTQLHPQAEGWLCGRQGRYVELLQRTFDESRRWNKTTDPAEVATFAMSPHRFQSLPDSVDLGALRWNRPLPRVQLPRSSDRLPFLNDPLCYHPVVYDQLVLVNDADTIHAWNLLTGDPAWQSERRDPSVIYPPVLDEPTPPPDKLCVGTPHFTMTIADNRLFARMGSPVTCSSAAELRRDFASELICLDLQREGKLLWKLGSQELFPDETIWRFEGTPVVIHGRAYVALCRRHPQLELSVVCLNAVDGRLIWKRSVGAFRASVDDANNRVSHLLLTSGMGRIFLSTDAGAIVALDAADGRLEWAISYETRIDELPGAPVDAGRRGLVPPLFFGGRLFVAPIDSNFAYCIDAASGRVNWRYAYLRESPRDLPDVLRREQDRNRLREKQWRHLLGVVEGGSDGRLIVTGNALTSIDVDSGLVVWERALGGARNARNDFGRGLIADRQILVPTRETIEIYDSRTGDHVREFPLKTPDVLESGGNLILAGGMLLVAETSRLSAYCEYSRLKVRIESELTERPTDVRLRIRLAELESSEGKLDEAAAAFRTVLEQTGPEQSIQQVVPGKEQLAIPVRQSKQPDLALYYTVRRKLSRLLFEAGNAELAKAKLEQARDYWSQALTVVDDVTQQIELIIEIARADEALKRPEAAVAGLQTILDRPRLATVQRHQQPAGIFAAEEIWRLVRENGREVYAKIEEVASQELATALKAADRRPLKQWIQRYPHSASASDARMILAEKYRTAGELSEAYATLQDVGRGNVEEQITARADFATFQLLRDAGYENSLHRFCTSLIGRASAVTVEHEGKSIDLRGLAQSQLQASSEPALHPSYLDRTWSMNLSPGAITIVPEGRSPADLLSAVLICTPLPDPNQWKWQCIDWRSGTIRWEEIATDPMERAAWTQVHLLIGTPTGWHARNAETGKTIWNQITLAPSESFLVASGNPTDDEALWPASYSVERGVQFWDPETGELIAHLKPPARLHRWFGSAGSPALPHRPLLSPSAAPDHEQVTLLLQSIRPTRTWFATSKSPRDRWSIREIAASNGLWQDQPVIMGKHFFSVTQNHALVGQTAGVEMEIDEESTSAADILTANRSVQWSLHSLPASHCEPFAFQSRDSLLVLLDGMQLASLDPQTGARRWLTSIADYPIASPQQICTDGDVVFATSEGTLRGISVSTGQLQIQSYLGDTASQWRTTAVWKDSALSTVGARHRSDTLIAAWPISPTNSRHLSVRVFDAGSGTVVQHLAFDEPPEDLVFLPFGFGIAWSKSHVRGFKFALPDAANVTAASPAIQ